MAVQQLERPVLGPPDAPETAGLPPQTTTVATCSEWDGCSLVAPPAPACRSVFYYAKTATKTLIRRSGMIAISNSNPGYDGFQVTDTAS